jgi:hypothetical protein
MRDDSVARLGSTGLAETNDENFKEMEKSTNNGPRFIHEWRLPPTNGHSGWDAVDGCGCG